MNKKHSFSEIPAMRSKWKCNLCGKVLASKQNIEKHIEKLHPSCEKVRNTILWNMLNVRRVILPKNSQNPKLLTHFFLG